MKHQSLFFSLSLLLFAGLPATAAEAPPAQLDERHRRFFKNYCVECHGAEKQEGKLRLDDISFEIGSIELADRWQKILNQLNAGEMPPEEAEQPDRDAKTEFLDALAGTLVTARRSLSDGGGKITMRRLNRREYKNTIRDLLGVDLNVRELPADGGAGTFDTVGASLFISSDQFEQYLALGRQAIDEHFARHATSMAFMSRRMHLEVEEKNSKIARSLAARIDARERYSKWTAAVDAAAQSEKNAVAVAGIRAEKQNGPAHLYFQWRRIAGAPSPADFGFVDAVNADEAGRRDWVHYVPHQKAYLEHPATKTGVFLTVEDVFVSPYQPFRIPGDWPAGDYVVRVRIGAAADTPASRRFVEFGSQHDSGVRAAASSHQVTGTVEKPQILEIPLKFSPAKGHGFFFQERGTYESEEVAHRIFSEAKQRNGVGPEFALWIDWIEVEAVAESPTVAAASSSVVSGAPRTIRERREVEEHANRMVGGTYNGYFKGGYEAAKAFLAAGKPQKGIPDEQEAKFRVRAFEQHGPSFERYLNDPLTKTGAFLTIFNVHPEEAITLPPDQPSGWLKTKHEVEKAEPGEYVLRFRIGAAQGAAKERRFVELGSRMKPEEKEDFTLMGTFQISGTTDAPQIIEVPVSISANGPRTFILREKRDVKLDHELYTTAVKETKVGPPSALWLDWVEWEGPLVKPASVARVEHIEPETRRAEVERGHLRFKYLNEQYAKWKAAGGDETRLKEFDFIDKSHAEFAKTVWDQNNRWFQQYLDRPLSKTGLYLDNTVQETSEYAVDVPADAAGGDYVLRVKIGRVPDMPAERAFLTFVEASPIDKDDRTFLANKQITASIEKPEVIELPFTIRSGGPRKFVLFEKRPLKKEAVSLPGRTRAVADAKQRDPVLWIDWIEYEGPWGESNSAAAPSPLVAKTHDGVGARELIERFAVRAFRDRAPQPEYVDKLVKLFEARIRAGEKFETAIREPLSVVLASPRFLYLVEPADEDQPRTLTARELATRLSYFLWSAPPDETLLALARSGELQQPEVLAEQVDRLIDGDKSREFVTGFAHQWLDLDRLDFFQFNTQLYRDFDESTKAAARTEVFRTIEHVLRENRSVRELLKADYVVVNGLLAAYYGLDGVSGDEFRKVSLPAGSPRGGLLGMAGIMAMGSNGEVSSPVERGAWVLRKLLHDPPPPAPPNVPQLTRLEGKLLTTRERILAHQEEPQCASCHRKIDPIGFGLENFNAVGKWRTEDSYEKKGVGKKTWSIDPGGTFHKGPAFKDFFELRDIIASKPEQFSRGLTEALIEYSLGRPYGFSDQDLAARIVKEAAKKEFALREFIHAVVRSKSFHTK